jgi:hypothetical protein
VQPLLDGGAFFESPRWRVSAFTDSSLNDMVVDDQGLRPPEGLGCFACALGGPDGRTPLVCAAPDFLETNRRAARDAVLLTAVVEIPHAGRP